MSLSITRLFVGISIALVLALPASAHDHSAGAPASAAASVAIGDLSISGAFARATLPNAPVGGVYLTIANGGSADDRLVSASSPVAGSTQLHEMKMDGDVMQMAELPDGIPVPAGQSVTLSPGGLHIMLMSLTQPLVEGTSIQLALVFEKAGSVEVAVPVGAIDAGSGADDAHTGHAMHGAGMNMSDASLPDAEAIAQMQKAMFDKPDSPLDMGPVVVVGEYAISDWAQGGMGGRALLRKTEKGWGIHLCAGDGLKDPAQLRQIGVPADIADQLAKALADAEAHLEPAALALYGSFDGTMMVDASLIKAGS